MYMYMYIHAYMSHPTHYSFPMYTHIYHHFSVLVYAVERGEGREVKEAFASDGEPRVGDTDEVCVYVCIYMYICALVVGVCVYTYMYMRMEGYGHGRTAAAAGLTKQPNASYLYTHKTKPI